MDIVDRMLQYWNEKTADVLLIKYVQLNDYDLYSVIVKILSWLKLEHKRGIWMAEGRKTCYKSLPINKNYPWCVNLCALVEKEDLFREYFFVSDGKFDFASSVNETDRMLAREKAYKNYNPEPHTL